MNDVFRDIYIQHRWSGESRSGPGSDRDQAGRIGANIACILRQIGARSLLDIGCGDFFWMRDVDLGTIEYIGIDVVPEMITANNEYYARPRRTFRVLDVTREIPPKADAILCRDCMMHLSIADTVTLLANVFRSGAKWLLATSFGLHRMNREIKPGEWYAINLLDKPFSLPAPQFAYEDWWPNESWKDKYLGLWEIG